MTHALLSSALLAACLIGLPACAAPASQQAANASSAKPAPAGTHEGYLKPGLPVAVQADELTMASAGEVGTVAIALPGVEDGMTVALSSSTGLEVLGAPLRDARAGESMNVDVRAPLAGRHYLDVVVTGADGLTRTASVPVQVGKDMTVVGSKPVEVVIGPDGTPRRVMRAQETINGVAVESETTTLGEE